MRFGLIYATPGVYGLAMRAIYRGKHDERFRAVADEVEDGDVVADLCAGTDFLYNALAGRGVVYTAYDINPVFVRALRDRGIEAHCLNVETAALPEADVLTMSSALYHFHPRCDQLLDRMRAKARKKVVLVEPVRNNSNSALPLWGRFARWASRVDGREVPFHFDQPGMERLLDGLGGPQRRELICGERDMRVVLDARAYGADPVAPGGGLCAKTS